jgi:uncharacterized delta-60 repeat protein
MKTIFKIQISSAGSARENRMNAQAEQDGTGTTTRRLRMHKGWRCLLGALALAAGCKDAPTPGEEDMGRAPDLTGADIAGAAEAKPQVLALSAAGHDRLLGAAYGPQGSFYATGIIADGADAAADFKTVVARFTAAGALDPGFGKDGLAVHNIVPGAGGEVARGIVVQSSGKVVVAATVEHAGAADPRDRDVAILRFNTDGTLDRTFGSAGVALLDLSNGEVVGDSYVADNAWGLTAYPDDRLLVSAAQKRAGATDTDFAIVRLTADGARDKTFGTDGVFTLDINNRSANPRNTTLLPGGGIVAGGYMNDGGVVKPVAFRLTSDGKLDTSFATGGVFSQPVLAAITEIYAIGLQGTSLVTVGYGRAAATESLDWVSLRLTEKGVLDPTYGTSGFTRLDVAGFNDNGRHLVVLPDRRVLLVGGGRPTETNVDGMVAVLTPDGQKDTRFSPMGYKLYDFGGTSDFFWGAALSPDQTRVALVGAKSSGATGNDDAVVMTMPLSR